MKKLVCLLLALSLLLSFTAALAEDRVTVDQQNLHVVLDYYWNYGYAYAKVTNVSNEPLRPDEIVFEIKDENGEFVPVTKYGSTILPVIEPGEKTYVWFSLYSTELENITDETEFMITVTASAPYSEITCFPVEASIELDVAEGWFTYDYVNVTFTNTTDEILYEIHLYYALLDAQGNILYIDGTTPYSLGVMPGSTIVFRDSVSSDYLDYLAEKGMVPEAVDAVAFVYND